MSASVLAFFNFQQGNINMKAIEPHLFLVVIRSLLKDAEAILGLETNCLQGDLEKITALLKNRGVPDILLLRFPQLCNDLEKSLSSGRYIGTAGTFVKQGKPTVFLPVYSLIFDSSWQLLGEPSPEAIRVLRQILKVFKKFRIDCPNSAIEESINEFKQIERDLPSPTLSWGRDDLDFRGIYPSLSELGDLGFHTKGQSRGQLTAGWGEGGVLRDLVNIQYVADRLSKSFRVHWSSFNPRHGPGSVSERYGSSKWEFPTWPNRLDRYFPLYQWGVLNELNVELDELRPDSPAKLVDVPKSYRGPRLIASEPISSQFIQQGIMDSLRKSLKTSVLRNCYDPYSQDPSRDLVISASADRSFSTIDLSSASDRMSCWLVERIFRKNYSLLQAFNSARTPKLVYPDGTVEELAKFAAQGAAFTFPVQSITYAIICMGVIYASNPKMRWNDIARKVRVYGDDIIIPTRYFRRVCNALEACFLKVNHEKSFSEGYFRESCGMDAYKGHDVTPANILNFFSSKRPLDTLSLVEASNNLYLKGFVETSAALRGMIPQRLLKNIPFVSPDCNIQMGFFGAGVTPLQKRTNIAWQCEESYVLEVDIKVHKTVPSGLHSLTQWFSERPPADSVNWQPGYPKKVAQRYLCKWVPSFKLGSRYST